MMPSVSAGSRSPSAARLALLVVAVVVYASAFQGSRALWEPDEGRYVALASRMLRSGDFLVPAFNPRLPHFAKPPLTYWSIASGLALLGWNEWGARLANALAFAATVLVVYAMAKRITPRRPWLPPLAYATFPLPFLTANLVTTDTLLTLFESVGMLGFVEWWSRRGESNARGPRWLMWTGLAVAFLTKGPPAFLPLLAIFAFVALAGGKRALRAMFGFEGLATFAVLGCSWYVAVARTHPGVMTYFLQHEVWGRITSAEVNRNPEWYGPFVVYGPALLLGTLPWTISWLRGVRFARRWFERSWWREQLRNDPWHVFLALAIALPLIVLSISRSRLPFYVVPVCVPLALCVGRAWEDREFGRTRATLAGVWAVLLVAAKGGAASYAFDGDSHVLAQKIEQSATRAPSEIVFIDNTPSWGVSFYLRCDAQHIEFADGGASRDVLLDELTKGLAPEDPGAMLVVKKQRVAITEEALATLGRQGRNAGELGSLVLLESAPKPDSTPNR